MSSTPSSTRSSTPRRKPAAVRRAEIADAAEAIARASGLSAVTMRSVAAAAGVTPTLVVHHVDSMDALVANAFDRIVGAELADMQTLAGERADTHLALQAVLIATLDGAGTEVTRVWVEAWVLGERNAVLAERARDQMDAWREFLAGLITAGIGDGRYRTTDARAVAGQILGMVDGISAHALVGWQDDTHRVALMLRAVDAMLGVGEA